MFTAAHFTIAKTWKQPNCPSREEWIKKMWYICTMEYYSTIKKNGIMQSAATWMDLECHVEWSQSEEKYHIISLNVESKKKRYKWRNLYNRNRLTDFWEGTYNCRGKGRRDSQRVWDWHVHTAIFKMDNQQGHTVNHMEFSSMLCGSLERREVWGRMDTSMYI